MQKLPKSSEINEDFIKWKKKKQKGEWWSNYACIKERFGKLQLNFNYILKVKVKEKEKERIRSQLFDFKLEPMLKKNHITGRISQVIYWFIGSTDQTTNQTG